MDATGCWEATTSGLRQWGEHPSSGHPVTRRYWRQSEPTKTQGSDGLCCRRQTRAVGPPSVELDRFGAMNLQIQWLEKAGPPLRVGIFNCWGPLRIGQVQRFPGLWKPCRLRAEQQLWSSARRPQPAARWSWLSRPSPRSRGGWAHADFGFDWRPSLGWPGAFGRRRGAEGRRIE